MRITKLGHCCLVIEEDDVRIMTDPGAYSTKQNDVTGIDIILFTHEHQDHFHLESLKTVLKNNPQAVIYTNTSVGKLLDAEKIPYAIIADGQSATVKGILIEGFGMTHATIYPSWPAVENTGYFLQGRLFYPGDAFYDPKKPVEILALPVSGPWMKISEAVDYAKALRPKVCFPVHDGMLKFGGPNYSVPQNLLPAAGVPFVVIQEGETREF